MARSKRVTFKGMVSDEKVLTFYCKGERYGKPSHVLSTLQTNTKGGLVTIPVKRGKPYKLDELPIGLRKKFRYGHINCCNKPMARQAHYPLRSGKVVWWFRCRSCGGQKGFYSSGERHLRYSLESRKIIECPDCRKPMVKAGSPKASPNLQKWVCNNYQYQGQHRKRFRYFHRVNGREYTMEGRGSQWMLKPVQANQKAA
jgi:hypothetical protein